jgi:hypothetical protein
MTAGMDAVRVKYGEETAKRLEEGARAILSGSTL